MQAFEQTVDTWNYLYTPAENYQLQLEIKFGEHYKQASPPAIAVWLENSSGYHVKPSLNQASKTCCPTGSGKLPNTKKPRMKPKTVGTTLNKALTAIEEANPDALQPTLGW